jgi:hypothetical protein
MTDNGTRWDGYTSWHHLLDSLCVEQGYLDNMKLADAFCATSGSRTESAFDTALKNLRNWRAGTHLPQRRNFLILTGLLKIDDYDGLRPIWNNLYHDARSPVPDNANDAMPEPVSALPATSEPKSQRRRQLMAASVVDIAAIGIASWLTWPDPAPDPETALYGLVEANYVRNVTLSVGEAMIIHGARGNNCGPAPDWEVAKELMPELQTGTLSNGGLGTRFSRQCGGNIPARAILYTATNPGVEQFNLYGDPIVATVTQ